MTTKKFERDLERKLNKAKRDISILVLYDELRNISQVADRLDITRNTVKKVLKLHYHETQKYTYAKIDLSQNKTPKKSKNEKSDNE